MLTGGKASDNPELQTGCYVEPTVVTAQPDDRVCQEESSGRSSLSPRFKDEAEVVGIANSTDYGLGGGLWTRDLQRGTSRGRRHPIGHGLGQHLQARESRVAVRRRGQSGYGREMGFEAIHDYTDAKSVWVNVDANIPPFYKR